MEKDKILKMDDFFDKKIRELKPKITQIDEDVSKISKDEFTAFRINKNTRELDKLYIQGRYDFDDSDGEIG